MPTRFRGCADARRRRISVNRLIVETLQREGAGRRPKARRLPRPWRHFRNRPGVVAGTAEDRVSGEAPRTAPVTAVALDTNVYSAFMRGVPGAWLRCAPPARFISR